MVQQLPKLGEGTLKSVSGRGRVNTIEWELRSVTDRSFIDSRSGREYPQILAVIEYVISGWTSEISVNRVYVVEIRICAYQKLEERGRGVG